jgi:dUTP pyrophosphatase
MGQKKRRFEVIVKIQKLHPDAKVPRYASAGAACFDLHAIVSGEPKTVGDSASFRTGLSFEIPPGHVMMIFSRSGHGFNADTRLSNCVGIIDPDYRGEVAVKLRRDSFGGSALAVSNGDRIAQAIVLPYPHVEFEVVEELSATERGAGGFGSTGK